MRRTATLSLYADDKENNLANVEHLFSINKKCKLELGIVNNVPNYNYILQDKEQKLTSVTIDYRKRYGDIIWFPLGYFVMFNPSIAHGLDGITISMQLKDKMCLLNGDLGGEIHSSVEFSNQDELVDSDSVTLEKNPVLIYNIIKQLVNHWGNEQLTKIIISEVPLQIKQAVKWTGNLPAYVISSVNSMLCTSKEEAIEWCNSHNISTDNIRSYQPGYDIGFIYTDFTYPGQLVCNAGQTVTSVLDKIIGVIGNYQYFYDVQGNFVFRQKQNYLNMTNTAYWTKEQAQDKKIGNLPTQVYNADAYRLSKPVYNFIGNNFVVNYNNSLNYNNIKNDFVVWGSRPTTNSNYRVPCRFHLAIDRKPSLNTHNIALYKDSSQTVRAVAYNEKTKKPEVGTELFPTAISELAKGKIYQIIQNRQSVDWREEIYYQMCESEKLGTDENTEINNSYFQYYAELKEEFPKIFDLENQVYKSDMEFHPDEINYFLDFIDEDSQLGQYSVNNIGRRSKIIGDNNEGINCVFEPMIPDIVYLDINDKNNSELTNKFTKIGQIFVQIPSELYNLLQTGGSLNSCFEKIKDLLYQYSHVNNTISLTTLPLYYLDPNTRITIEDAPSGIYGDYIIQSLSIPFDVSSTMSINAYKALQKI